MNELTTTTTTMPSRLTPRLIFGLGIFTIGLLWTLDNVNLIESERYTQWWPVMLILAGAVRLLDVRGGKSAPVALIVVGTLLLLGSLDVIDFDFGDMIPLAVVLLGGKLVFDALGRKRMERPPTTEPGSVINATAIMAGNVRRSTSTDFRGGESTAIMGGVELDLRNAQVREGQEAVIDVFAFWGGIEIKVPENWRVASDVMPLMGGFEDNTATKGMGNGPALLIRGTAIMGGVEVKN